jgi:uncharacterized protein YndB with AHSA1/START domain
MTDRHKPATTELIVGRQVLRFERRYDVSVSELWRAMSDPAELARWFPSKISWTPACGEAIVIDDLAGVITELEDARRIVFIVGPEYYRFEVHEAQSGSRLVFIHGFDEHAASAAQFAAGWEAYLERLEAHLNGGFLSEEDAHEQSASRSAFYAERFGNAAR